MKILIVMGGFFPGKKFGGPPASVDNFCSLMKEHSCYIVTRNHDMGETESYASVTSGWNDRGNCNVLYLPDAQYNKTVFESVIKEIGPDLIYLQGLFQGCVIPCLMLAKKYNIKVLLAPRGELCAGAFRKKYKKIPYILVARALSLLKKVHFQSTSDEETAAIKKYLKAQDDRVHFLTNIPSIPQNAFSRPSKKSGEGRFVFLSRIHPKKNLLKAIEFFSSAKGDIVFDIYGSIEDESYWKLCLEKAKALPSNVKVNYCGLIDHNDVHSVFSRYDAFLFPTMSENYGHVIAEALIVGCPVIVSDQTPWNDMENNNAGFVSALSDEASFVKAIQHIVDLDSDSMSDNAKIYAEKKMNLKSLKTGYETVLAELNKT